MTILVMLNNFLHDFSAAGWVFGSVLLWSILRKDMPVGDAVKIIIETLKTVLLLMRLSVIGIVVFGVLRTMAYKSHEWNAAAGGSQITLILVKHIILVGIFLLGLLYYLRATRLVRKSREKDPE